MRDAAIAAAEAKSARARKPRTSHAKSEDEMLWRSMVNRAFLPNLVMTAIAGLTRDLPSQ